MYVAALDIGTTTVRFHVLNKAAETVASLSQKVNLIYPQPGYVEIDPNELWQTITKMIKDVLTEIATVNQGDINRTHRNQQYRPYIDPFLRNFIAACLLHYVELKDRVALSQVAQCRDVIKVHSGIKFITWKDQRAAALVDEWNHSMTMKGVRMGARLLYTLTRNKRFLAGSVLKFLNGMVTMKLIWVLENIPGLRQAAEKGEVAFGGIDSWLLYKLTGKHIMDVSCASGTGLFDPFTMQWANWGIHILKLPRNIFPEIVDTMGYFGVTPVDLFGVEIPICCSVADQSGSLFGSGCFYPGDLKITMGTGTFMNVNTGSQPHASVKGLYPVVGWRIKNELVYLVEGASYDTGILVEWAKEIGLVSDAKETANIAKEVDDSNGVYFIPAFSGLQAPINNPEAAAGFIGIKPTTKKAHIVRSLLESLVFRIMMLYECLWDETSFTYKKIRIDGGVSGNDFIMQLLSDLTGLDVERSESVEMSILGTAFMAGLEGGLWRSREEIMKLCRRKVIFNPNMVRRESYKNVLNEWKRAVDRFKNWY